VTAPFRASVRPSTAARVFSVIEVQRQNAAPQNGASSERGRAADLPSYTFAGPGTADEDHPTARCRDQRRAPLKDEDGIGVAMGVQREIPGQTKRGMRICRPPPSEYVRPRSAGLLASGDSIRCVIVRGLQRPFEPARQRHPSRGWCRAMLWIGSLSTAVPGLKPRSPVMVVGPVLVIVEPARTAKASAVPRPTGA